MNTPHKLTQVIEDKLNAIISKANLAEGQIYFLNSPRAKQHFSEFALSYMIGLGISVVVTDIGVRETLTTFFLDNEMDKLITVEVGG